MRPSEAITLSVLFIYGLQAAPLTFCPKSCTCIGTEIYCKSFNILPQLSDSDTITKLVINNSTASTNPKLNHLLQLKTLNLASNKIKQLNSLHFPKSLEYLDLSDNFITSLPQDFHSTFTALKELRLTGNPISCTCDSIATRDHLLQKNVIIATPVKCHTPENLHGKSWLLVSCVDGLFGEMQGDAPYEGSGFDDVVAESELENNNQDKSLEEEFIRIDSTTPSTKLAVSTTSIFDDIEEGSGNDGTTPLIGVEDEDSDNSNDTLVNETPIVRVNDLLLHNVKACNFDCSTTAPSENDDNALPPPGVFEGVKIVWDDFSILKGGDASSSSTTSTPTTTPHNFTDTEVLTKQIAVEDKGKITEEAKESNFSTYIFLGALLVLIIALVVYAVIKKRARKPHSLSSNTEKKVVPSNEVELLKATKPNGTHEVLPLMNGHSDTIETPYEDVELRQKPNEADGENSNLLVPETKRVTIKASEIPNSTPRTPILVTRHLNSDGSVVTTPTVHHKV